MQLSDTTTAVTVDLQVCPQLGRSAEQVRAKIVAYLDRMHSLGKAPSAVTLFASDYDCLLDTLKRKAAASHSGVGKPPPHRRAELRRHPRATRREGVSHAA